MKKPTIKQLTSRKGYCCPFGYFIANRALQTKEMAEDLGAAPRTIRHYKQLVKERKCNCANRAGCYFSGSSK